ncbi:MAG: hypothetical protein ACR2OG_17565 [Gemmatimonadaceae bacterium]
MTNTGIENSEQAVATLFLDRQRYEQWLAGLEAKKSATAPHVYERVHADYTARLQRVIEQLVSHTAVIEEMEKVLGDRLTSLDIDEVKHRDELAEAELRAAVGEFSPEACDEQIDRCQQALAAINMERESLTGELTRLRSVLELVEPAPARTSGSQPAHEREPTDAGANGDRGGSAGGGFDELEFLKSLSGASDDESSGEAPTRTSTAHPSAAAPQPGRMPTPVESPRAAPPIPEVRSRETRESVPAFLKDVPPEQVKTLKCQECGTLNYPTEWYCERCGAELAAL